MKYSYCGGRVFRKPHAGAPKQCWMSATQTWSAGAFHIADNWQWYDSVEDLLDFWKRKPKITRFIVEELV